MRSWLRRKILIDFEIKNEKTVDKFYGSEYNRSKERLKTENT